MNEVSKPATLADLTTARNHLSTAIGLFSSAIRSGESWSSTCTDVLEKAKPALLLLHETASRAAADAPVTLTPEQREKLKEELQAIDEARKPLETFIAPVKNTLRQLDDMQFATLERYGIDGETADCELCCALIIPGDNYAAYEDGPIACQACAPTYADALRQQRETAADESADPDDRQAAAEAVGRMEAMTPEELAQKIVSVWQP